MKNFLNKVFKIEENKTTIKTEIIAGLTTFFAMCYIVIVNPNQMIGAASSTLYNVCFVGGIIAAVIATLCMAFIANKPFALAAGMGLNSFFFVSFIAPNALYEIVDGKEVIVNADGTETFNNLVTGYNIGLTIILLSGLLFLILSFTGVRKYLATALPTCLKIAIPAGIGLFIAFLGLQNSGLVISNQYTLVAIADFTNWNACAPALVAFLGLIVIVVFSNSKIKFLKNGAVILGIIISTAIYYIFSIWTPSLRADISETASLGKMFTDWANYGIFKFDFIHTFDGSIIGSVFSAIMLVITYCLIDMFDTIGTLYGASSQANMLDENGDPIGLSEEMLCDSIGTVAGAMVGTSTVTTFVESASGVAAGGRTGLSSFVTACLFIVCLFIGPLVSLVPTAATAPALIYVGILMLKGIIKADFEDPRSAATVFMTVIFMIATYSISNGIMVGALTYVLVTLLTGKYTKKDIIVTIIALLGVLKFAFVTI